MEKRRSGKTISLLKLILGVTMMITLWAIIVILVIIASAQWLGNPDVEIGNLSSIEQHLKEKLKEAVDDKNLGSAALVLLYNGKVVTKSGFGISDAETKAPVRTDQTLFQMASVSKTVTAVGVMKLVQEGLIGLDEPVMQYLKKWQFKGSKMYRDKITIRRLLSHTAGLSDGEGFGTILPGEQMPTLEASMANAGNPRVVTEPGTAMMYGNGNYAVLQLLVEDVAKLPFAAYMKEQILEPLGMNNSYFNLDVNSDSAKALAPNLDKDLKPLPYFRYTATGAVALYSTAEDMASFAMALTKENNVVKKETLDQMMRPEPATGNSWGLGVTLFTENGKGGYIVGHDGGAYPAWGAVLRVNPSTGNGMVMMVSGSDGAVNQLAHDWVYWETGIMTTDAKRQLVYDRMKVWGFLSIIAGAIIIGIWQWKQSKSRIRTAVH